MILINCFDEIIVCIVDILYGFFGYICLWMFYMKDGDINVFFNEFIWIVIEEMFKEGVILDVWGNGGGFIIVLEFLF